MMREPLRDPDPCPGRGGKRCGGALQASSVQSIMEPSHLSSTLMAEEEGAHGETEAIAIQVTGETSSQHSPENQSRERPCCRKPGKSLAEQPCFFKARYSSVPSQGVTQKEPGRRVGDERAPVGSRPLPRERGGSNMEVPSRPAAFRSLSSVRRRKWIPLLLRTPSWKTRPRPDPLSRSRCRHLCCVTGKSVSVSKDPSASSAQVWGSQRNPV
ncbi:uncharacterized protein [Phaenicophaeus curvirostris]|uniref:uncharacterized protein isoform X3 n=1 Tax=Phaenicophaeus curvirostris TaxID=33595 RepID=UPI0037F0EFE0